MSLQLSLAVKKPKAEYFTLTSQVIKTVYSAEAIVPLPLCVRGKFMPYFQIIGHLCKRLYWTYMYLYI